MEEQEWCTSQRSSKAYVLKTCGLIHDGVIKSSKRASSFCPQHLLHMSFPAFINFSRFTSSACLSGRGLITGLSHSANFWSWTVFCLWSQSSAEKVGNRSPSTFYQNCYNSDWTEKKKTNWPDWDLWWNIFSLLPVERFNMSQNTRTRQEKGLPLMWDIYPPGLWFKINVKPKWCLSLFDSSR